MDAESVHSSSSVNIPNDHSEIISARKQHLGVETRVMLIWVEKIAENENMLKVKTKFTMRE